MKAYRLILASLGYGVTGFIFCSVLQGRKPIWGALSAGFVTGWALACASMLSLGVAWRFRRYGWMAKVLFWGLVGLFFSLSKGQWSVVGLDLRHFPQILAFIAGNLVLIVAGVAEVCFEAIHARDP